MNTPGHFTDLYELIHAERNRLIEENKRLRQCLMWVSDESKERRVRSFAARALNYHGQADALDGVKRIREQNK